MQRTVGVIGVIALALAGCKKPGGGNIGEVMKTFEGFAAAMCACKDKACADHVQEGMTKWSMELAKNADSTRAEKPDEAAMKAMVDLGQMYADCMTKIMAPEVPVVPAEPPPRPPVKLSMPADRPSIAMLIHEAKAYTHAADDHLAVHVLQLRYVRPDGALDPTHGELTIGFGNPLPTPPAPVAIQDDPDRLTGAPIPEPSAPVPVEDSWSKRSMCPSGVWSSTSGWAWGERPCSEAADLLPRCAIAEVWKRAQAKRAPDKALAVLELVTTDDAKQQWNFSIDDRLRKVDIDLEIADTCAAVVEKP